MIADRHLKKSSSSKCEFHPTQTLKYYCSDPKCRTSLCLICIKTHPKEHLQNLTTIEDVKSQTLDLLKKETVDRFDTFLDQILKSNKMNDLFKQAFGNLMQQNTTVGLDDEDIADILADTLQRKYFEKGIVMNEKIEEDVAINFSSANLIAFDYKFDNGEERNHKEDQRKFCRSSAEFYRQEQFQTFYAESKGQVIFWSPEEDYLLCKDIINPKKSKKYEIPFYSQFLTVLESEERLLFVGGSEDQLTVYAISEETFASEDKKENPTSNHYPPLKVCNEFSLEENIVFLASDHVNHLFVVTQEGTTLTANIYSVSHELELTQLLSFEPFDSIRKVVFDRANSLIFILFGDLLAIYKYQAAKATSLRIIFKIKTSDFRWNQATKKLLLVDSKKLYQLDKGKLRLLRVITSPKITPLGLTSQGVFYNEKSTSGLSLLSQKNPQKQYDVILPSVKYEMEFLQEESMERLFCDESDSEIKPTIGKLQTTYNAVEVLAETSDSLLIYANITYSQEAFKRLRYNKRGDCGGTIYTQYLLKYNLKQREYNIGK